MPAQKDGPRVNQEIRSRDVQLIDQTGVNRGVTPTQEAITIAQAAGLDLVEISPNTTPPICKILDYGKYKYQAQKKAAEARKKQKTVEVKEIKLRPGIDTHDYDVKMRSMRRFFEEGGAKVTFRPGREMAPGPRPSSTRQEDTATIAKVCCRRCPKAAIGDLAPGTAKSTPCSSGIAGPCWPGSAARTNWERSSSLRCGSTCLADLACCGSIAHARDTLFTPLSFVYYPTHTVFVRRAVGDRLRRGLFCAQAPGAAIVVGLVVFHTDVDFIVHRPDCLVSTATRARLEFRGGDDHAGTCDVHRRSCLYLAPRAPDRIGKFILRSSRSCLCFTSR
jgi:translation initiation factor IF-3